jgi:hypothetical protein
VATEQQGWVRGKGIRLGGSQIAAKLSEGERKSAIFLEGGEVGKAEAPLLVAPNGGVQESASSSALRISRENLLADLETP